MNLVVTHVASAHTFRSPEKGSLQVANARPWLKMSVTWLGRYVADDLNA